MSVDPARVAAWQALSELFLDTELDDADISAIARRLDATGFSVPELERIYEQEVAPVCWRNLRALPGGAWSGFEKKWLVEAIQRQRGSRGVLDRLPGVSRLRLRRLTALSRVDWERVKQLLAS